MMSIWNTIKSGLSLGFKRKSNPTRDFQTLHPNKAEQARLLCLELSSKGEAGTLLGNDLVKIQVRLDDRNYIHLYEEVMAINDVYWVVEAHLESLDESNVDWLLSELDNPNWEEWDTEGMFDSRIAVSERYGFSNKIDVWNAPDESDDELVENRDLPYIQNFKTPERHCFNHTNCESVNKMNDSDSNPLPPTDYSYCVPTFDELKNKGDCDLVQAIRDKAYYLWVDAGQPHGLADHFWLEAEN